MKVSDRNSILNLGLIILSIYLSFSISIGYIFLWPAALLCDDLFYYYLGMSLFDPEIRVQRNYQFVNTFLTDQGGKGRDLEFGLYDGDLIKSIHQAQIDKWEKMLSLLKLEPGDSLIDIGCGYGDWLNYAKSKGIKVTGINISADQSEKARKLHGIEIICVNWKEILKRPDLQKKLYESFDAVTFMGSVEHFVPIKYRNKGKKQGMIYEDMFRLAYHLLKPHSKSQMVLISCLHDMKPSKSFMQYVRGYFFDKYYSGLYPTGDQGLSKYAKNYLEEVNRFDKTEDYRLATVLDPNHFAQYNIRWNVKKIGYFFLYLLLDPCFLHKWVEVKTNGWMHLQFGKNAWEKSYGQKHLKEERCVTLWWILWKKKTQVYLS